MSDDTEIYINDLQNKNSMSWTYKMFFHEGEIKIIEEIEFLCNTRKICRGG